MGDSDADAIAETGGALSPAPEPDGEAVEAAAGQPLTAKGILREAGPRLLRDALGPTLCFYVGWKTLGLWFGILLGSVFAFSAYGYERRKGRPGMIARLVLAFVVLQALVGLMTNSAQAYLIQPTILGAINGLVWLGSVAIGKPLAGVFASEVFPVDDETRASATYKNTFRLISVVWGTWFTVFAAIQFVVLLAVGVDAYVGLRVLDAVLVIMLIVWSVRAFTTRIGPINLPMPAAPAGEAAPA